MARIRRSKTNNKYFTDIPKPEDMSRKYKRVRCKFCGQMLDGIKLICPRCGFVVK